ncbi:hypothetical protein V7112_18350 [Bacillus sp. JJ1566]|uniref:hypothetical protein n=1 Tax=Bacillus sp. JJ1566 TaxID=3122961 RepID=UPI002FFE0B7F
MRLLLMTDEEVMKAIEKMDNGKRIKLLDLLFDNYYKKTYLHVLLLVELSK